MVTTKASRKSSQAADKVVSTTRYLDQHNASAKGTVIGEVVRWNARPTGANGKHTYQTVKAALEAAGLDTKYAKEFEPKAAFARAAGKMSQDRLIDIVREDDSEIIFQFTKKALRGEELEFEKETNLQLNRITGKVSCAVPELENKAQEELDRAMIERTTSDITKIIQAHYEDHGELIPFGEQGGVYIVPAEFMNLNDQVKTFLDGLGGRLYRLVISSGASEDTDETVAHSFAGHYQADLDRLQVLINGFTLNVRRDTIEATAQEIKDLKLKLKTHSFLLRDQADEVESKLAETDTILRNQIERIGVAQKERSEKNGQGGTARDTILGHSATSFIRWCGVNEWAYDEVKKVFDHFKVEVARSTITSQLASVTTGWRGKPAELTDEEIEEVYNIISDE